MRRPLIMQHGPVQVIESLVPAVAMAENVGPAIVIMTIMMVVAMFHDVWTACHTLTYALAGGAAFAFVDGLSGRRRRAGTTFGRAALALYIGAAIGVGRTLCRVARRSVLVGFRRRRRRLPSCFRSFALAQISGPALSSPPAHFAVPPERAPAPHLSSCFAPRRRRRPAAILRPWWK